MSFDLYERETQERLSAMPPVQNPEPGMFDGFVRGAGLATMKGLARVGRSIDMLGSVAPIAYDAFTGGTEAQTQYFKEHDDAWGSAVDYWTPKPGEVGLAAEVTGQLLSTLPVVIASPGLAVADTQIGTTEDLVKKGVSAEKAQAVGAVQGAGLGLGIWMPILGSNGWQRLVVGGAGFNVLQGVTTRAASGLILEGTPAAKDFEAFNGEALTLDVLLGLAFGGLAHINPAMRAQGGQAWERLQSWAQKLQPSDVAAIAALRQAQHLNVDSAPGKPAAPADVEAHVMRVRQAIEQISRGDPVEVSDLPDGTFERDAARATENDKRAAAMQREAQALAKAYDIVLEEPIGPVNDPLVRMTPDDIGEVLVERGPAFQQQGSADVKVGGYGLVKIIWKHGEKSATAPELQVTRDDVLRLPEVMREFKPIQDEAGPTGGRLLEWQVEREDGKKVVYATRKFTQGDERQHVITIMVNEEKSESMRTKPLSEKANRLAESPGGAVTARPGDTGPAASSIERPGGQKGGSAASIETEAPAGQPRGAEPPPPRGSSEGKPAGAEATTPDPLALEADRIVQELPERLLRVGSNPDGTPINMTAKEYLEGARADAKKLREDVELVQIAAQCLLGGGR